ncbi:MAG TPA: glycoside hydrolase domain-containing protein, partial [Streptosporangiaceae bacterium]|nr:glycoside hydrolase domain-containing protein [Streptosporangiaceae bacterium]
MNRLNRRKHTFRWPVAIALSAAGVFGIGLSTTVPAGASSAPTPVASPDHPVPTHGAGKTPKPRTSTCTLGANGRLSTCAKPVSASRLPAGARNRSTVSSAVSSPATMVDTRTWTSGGGNTFPGAEVPFGMTQWSPDTMPNRNAGGGYNYGDEELTGYSLTHVSGPGCGAAGDVPILPMTGALPSGDPSAATTSFTNTGEVAQAGYYSAESNLPNTITSQFTATPHSSMGEFTFPSTTSADFLIKLMDSQNGDASSTAQVVGNNEVMGSDTSGDFCGESDNDGQSQLYTVYFDVVFSQPFTASQVVTEAGQTDPDSVFLTFNTTSNQTIEAKVGISYVSAANAKLNWQTENPGWNFNATKKTAQNAWNTLLGRIAVSGGSYAQTQEFYSLLYKDFLQPNITSDVNGQFMGSD